MHHLVTHAGAQQGHPERAKSGSATQRFPFWGVLARGRGLLAKCVCSLLPSAGGGGWAAGRRGRKKSLISWGGFPRPLASWSLSGKRGDGCQGGGAACGVRRMAGPGMLASGRRTSLCTSVALGRGWGLSEATFHETITRTIRVTVNSGFHLHIQDFILNSDNTMK